MGVVKWGNVAQIRGGGEQVGSCFSFWDSGATEEEEEEDEGGGEEGGGEEVEEEEGK
jgi:hypothetical protein